jgi:hypothetical protein
MRLKNAFWANRDNWTTSLADNKHKEWLHVEVPWLLEEQKWLLLFLKFRVFMFCLLILLI